MKKILITGTCGFIFSNFIQYCINRYENYHFVGIDKIVKKENYDNMLPFKHDRFTFHVADIADAHTVDRIFELEKPDIVINGAAESFVDNSITDILPFLHTNIMGTQTIINACLNHSVKHFVQISTDEIYGQAMAKTDKPWDETTKPDPRNPYATSKYAAELIVKTAHLTHGLQYQMTRSCNVYGPRQKNDNLIPHIITKLKNNLPVNIHGNGQNFRQYIHVEDKIDAIMKIITKGEINTIYNIGAYNYFTNIEMVDKIAKILNVEPNINFIPDRKSHDMGYSVSTAKLQFLGWRPKRIFDEYLDYTVKWYERWR